MTQRPDFNMQNRSSPFLQQDRNLLIFLVVVGFIATFITSSRGDTEFSAFQVVTGILFGVMYLVIALFDEELLRRFTGNTRHIIYCLYIGSKPLPFRQAVFNTTIA